MFVIAHRGGAGLAPENTILAIKSSVACKVDAIEIDVQVTKDGHLVLVHDDTLLRIAGTPAKSSELSLAQIKKIKTKNGQPIPTLEQAVKAAGKTTLIIDAKYKGWPKPLADFIKQQPKFGVKVISYEHSELFEFSKLAPKIETYPIEDHRSIEAILLARKLKFTGVSLAAGLYNPLSYLMARHYKLKLITSPINGKWRVRFFHFFFPRAMVTTDFPNKI